MSENVLRELLGESLRREFAEFESAPAHKFSIKHRLAMKRILAKYEKNTRKTSELSAQTMPHYRLKQKVIFALVIVILMTLLTGWFFPMHRVTVPQLNLLRSRYDFQNMKIQILMPGSLLFNDKGFGLWKTNDDYLNFLNDLVQMGIYTREETDTLLNKTEPIDTRPVLPGGGQFVLAGIISISDLIAGNTTETPLDSTRNFVSHLEYQIDYYTKRSQDKERAVEGDAEFAALIGEHYLPLHKNYLELLEKLYAVPTYNKSEKSFGNVLYDFDKDDRRYLFNINETEKI